MDRDQLNKTVAEVCTCSCFIHIYFRPYVSLHINLSSTIYVSSLFGGGGRETNEI